VQLPHPAQRNLFLEKSLGGGGEEYLFGGIDGSHDVGYGLPSPLRMKAERVLVIRPIRSQSGFTGAFDGSNEQYSKRYRSSVDNDVEKL
jgi:hypothetical protein